MCAFDLSTKPKDLKTNMRSSIAAGTIYFFSMCGVQSVAYLFLFLPGTFERVFREDPETTEPLLEDNFVLDKRGLLEGSSFGIELARGEIGEDFTD